MSDLYSSQATGPQKVVLITGPSGSGRSTAINALEDLGFEAIDNLPLSLLPRLLSGPPIGHHLALGVDIRNRDFSADSLVEAVDIISRETEFDCSLVFLDCDTEVLARRYSETRRRHPLAPNETPIEGILRENAMLGALKHRADILIDTSNLTPHDLRSEISTLFGTDSDHPLAVSIQSFSYKRGMPHGLDMVLDCRFLRNPHWDAELRQKTGLDAEVGAYIAQDPRYKEFFQRTLDLVEFLLPAYRDEGKSYFTLGLGCTGGQHRSVYVAKCIANALAENGWRVSIRHRELERRAGGVPLGQ